MGIGSMTVTLNYDAALVLSVDMFSYFHELLDAIPDWNPDKQRLESEFKKLSQQLKDAIKVTSEVEARDMQ